MSSTEEVKPNVDNMSPEERKIFEKYGKLPKQSQLLIKKDKKFFDSADWAKGQHDAKEVRHSPTEKTIKE